MSQGLPCTVPKRISVPINGSPVYHIARDLSQFTKATSHFEEWLFSVNLSDKITRVIAIS